MRHHDRVPAFAVTHLLIILTLILALSATPAPTTAATLNVCLSGCTFSSIQAAISAANPNDTISISADRYDENLTINKNLTLSGVGADQTIIDGRNMGSVVSINTGFLVNIAGVTLQHGNGTGGGAIVNNGTLALNNSVVRDNDSQGSPGGGILNTGTLRLNNSTVTNNTASGHGGGIYSIGGAVTLNDSMIDGNTSEVGGGGGIAAYTSTLTLNNSFVRNNNALSAGGGIFIIYAASSMTMNHSTISGNTAGDFGGGIYNDLSTITLLNDSNVILNTANGPAGGGGIYNNGDITLIDSTISGNSAPQGDGGGIHNIASAMLTVDHSTISSNQAGSVGGGVGGGGGIASHSLSLAVLKNNSTVSGNTATGSGGGIYNAATLTMSDSQIIANESALQGGGIANSGTLTINDTVISANRLENPHGDGILNGPTDSREAGGGIFSQPGKLILNNTTISGHQVGGDPSFSNGGGLYLGGVTATLTNVHISGNEVIGSGAGINALNTTLTIIGSTISDNHAKLLGCPTADCNQGGGIGIYGNSTITITNSTISGNRSDNIAGGIMWHDLNQTTLLDHVTITNNTALKGGGGGIYRLSTDIPVHVRNSIIAGNQAIGEPSRLDCHGGIISEGGNLLGNNNNCAATNSDILTDPAQLHLDLLRPHGGRTPTHALQAGSPAFAATQSCPAQDQRGIPRPQTGGCAIGAYEPAQATELAFTAEPSQSLDQGEAFTARITARDAFGNVGRLTENVTLGIDRDPNHDGAGASHPNPAIPRANLIGTTSTSLVRGEATFTSLAIDQPGNGFLLRATSDTLSKQSRSLNVRATTPITVEDPLNPDPYESNNSLNFAVPIIFDTNNAAEYSATISSEEDRDVFRFIARPSSHITITLARPNEYDLVLLRDPIDVATDITDTLDLSNLLTLQRSDTPRGMVPRGMVPRGMVPSNLVSDTQSLDSLVVDANADPGTQPISVELRLPLGGTYYIAVLSTRHKHDLNKQYQMRVELQPGNLQLPTVLAQSPGSLDIEPSLDVRNIFLTNFPRMTAIYTASVEQQAAIGEIRALLSPGSAVMTQGVVLDLPSVLGPAALNNLNALYNQWDADANQPLLANELASQLQRILIGALRNYYPNATNLVLVGGDGVLPFARVPDENSYGNEQAYFASLQLESSALLSKSAFAASLSNGFMQTDDFYARRRSVLFRGRQLALADLGVGRLVELPTDIARYLRAYDSPESLVVRADQPSAGQPNTLVTSYDFLEDEAVALVKTLAGLGVKNVDQLREQDHWTTPQLEQRLFNGQLPKLTAIYTPTAGNPSTPYALVSLNGHFSHHNTQPATTTTDIDLEAARVLTPTVAAGYEPQAFFKRWQSEQESASLLYSIGCHSGLSAPDSAFGTNQAVFESADFASAVLKQGGNWIGNTGYGYADTEVVGYSEQLATFFTRELGRDVGMDVTYVPTTIGQAMMRAKQRYVREKGVGGFSVADEKVITGWTLYGLPFIQVRVPTPFKEAAPPPTKPPVLNPNGTFTRTIVVTADWSPFDTSALKLWEEGSVLAKVTDSLTPEYTQQVTGTPQGNLGAPVLPVLSIPLRIPLQNGRSATQLPQLRGVRLLEASGAAVQSRFSPKVTSPITDTTIAGASPTRNLSMLGLWTPDLTYGAVRIGIDQQGTSSQLRDVLLVHPAQFRATSARVGDLRRFTTMVLELTYIDPLLAPLSLRDDHLAPAITDLTIDGSVVARGPQAITFTATVSDGVITAAQTRVQQANGPVSGVHSVRVLYTADGVTWAHADLHPIDNGKYQAAPIVVVQNSGLFAYIDAVDTAGNITTRVIDRGVMRLYLSMAVMGTANNWGRYLPIIQR